VVSSGVPILALPGKTYSSRMSGSINNCLHLNHLNVQSIEEYIELAVKISTDFEFKSKIKAQLTEGINKSGLLNEKQFVHDFSKILFKVKDLCDRSITKKIVKI
jgi:predicted O-linked N-acetylglucosamine transferase (SPINDLY family)